MPADVPKEYRAESYHYRFDSGIQGLLYLTHTNGATLNPSLAHEILANAQLGWVSTQDDGLEFDPFPLIYSRTSGDTIKALLDSLPDDEAAEITAYASNLFTPFTFRIQRALAQSPPDARIDLDSIADRLHPLFVDMAREDGATSLQCHKELQTLSLRYKYSRLSEEKVYDVLTAHDFYDGVLDHASKRLKIPANIIQRYWRFYGLDENDGRSVRAARVRETAKEKIIEAHGKAQGNVNVAHKILGQYGRRHIRRVWRSQDLEITDSNGLSPKKIDLICKAHPTYHGSLRVTAERLGLGEERIRRIWDENSLVPDDNRGGKGQHRIPWTHVHRILENYFKLDGNAYQAGINVGHSHRTVLDIWGAHGLERKAPHRKGKSLLSPERQQAIRDAYEKANGVPSRAAKMIDANAQTIKTHWERLGFEIKDGRKPAHPKPQKKRRTLPRDCIDDIIRAHSTKRGDYLAVAQSFDFDPRSIRKIWDAHELPYEVIEVGGNNRTPDDEERKILRLYESKKGIVRHAARACGRADHTVKRIWEAHGLTPREGRGRKPKQKI